MGVYNRRSQRVNPFLDFLAQWFEDQLDMLNLTWLYCGSQILTIRIGSGFCYKPCFCRNSRGGVRKIGGEPIFSLQECSKELYLYFRDEHHGRNTAL